MQELEQLSFFQPNPGSGDLCNTCLYQIPAEHRRNDLPCEQVRFNASSRMIAQLTRSGVEITLSTGTLSADMEWPNLRRFEDETESCYNYSGPVYTLEPEQFRVVYPALPAPASS